MTRQSALSGMGKRQRPCLPYSPFATPEANATLFCGLVNRGGGVRLACNRRLDVPENMGGPASCGDAGRLGPGSGPEALGEPTGVRGPLSREEMNPGAREAGHGACGEAYPGGVPYARAAPTAETMHQRGEPTLTQHPTRATSPLASNSLSNRGDGRC